MQTKKHLYKNCLVNRPISINFFCVSSKNLLTEFRFLLVLLWNRKCVLHHHFCVAHHHHHHSAEDATAAATVENVEVIPSMYGSYLLLIRIMKMRLLSAGIGFSSYYFYRFVYINKTNLSIHPYIYSSVYPFNRSFIHPSINLSVVIHPSALTSSYQLLSS